MAEIINELTLDVARENRIQAVLGKQYDYKSRYLKVRIANNGEPIFVTAGTVVTINATRADKQNNSFLGVVNDDGTVTVPITQWMLALDDYVKCDISMTDPQGRKLTTANFTVEVEHSNYTGGNLAEVTVGIGSSTGITAATVDGTTFIGKVGTAEEKNYTFSYDGSKWTLGSATVTLGDYGITVTGTPASGDTVTVTVRDNTGGLLVDLLADIAELDAKVTQLVTNVRHYGARWNKTQAQMTRLYDAASFPTDITNFAHRGNVNANYSNPFDNIYPWAGIRLCNISIDLYRNLAAGDSITKCVTAWEGDVDFSYNDVNGVWRYRPEFWGKSWEDDTYRYFDVSEKAISSYVHYPEAIVGRWHGRTATMTIGGAEKTCLIPSVGMPTVRTPIDDLHAYAKNYGATIDSIYSIDADTLLCVVEFATMNTQNALGRGVTDVFSQSNLIQENATDSTTVKVLAAAGSAYCIPGAIFDIGTSESGAQVGSFTVASVATNVEDTQYLDVTLDRAVTVTTANYWSVHGIVNAADEAIGSKSGYIGTNGKCNAYYRGIVMYGNMWRYVLGAYESKDNQHLWIANSDEEADNYDDLDPTVHYDTGIVLPSFDGYLKNLGTLSRSGLLSIPAFGIEGGGNSSDPIGDGYYNAVLSFNSVPTIGGASLGGTLAGVFNVTWDTIHYGQNWHLAACPRLKNP